MKWFLEQEMAGEAGFEDLVAMTQVRLALRTPRGRASIGSALLMPLLIGGLAYRSGRMPIPGIDVQNGLGLAAFGAFASLLTLIPLAMNQFAVLSGDRFASPAN